MSASFWDTTCKTCGGTYGWRGTLADAPTACPRCGIAIPAIPGQLLETEAALDEARTAAAAAILAAETAAWACPTDTQLRAYAEGRSEALVYVPVGAVEKMSTPYAAMHRNPYRDGVGPAGTAAFWRTGWDDGLRIRGR